MPKNFENLPRSASHQVIQTANCTAMQDASDTPNKSPLAITTSITTIEIPENAAEIVLKSSVDIRIGVDADLSDGYYVAAANEGKTFGCASMDQIFVRGDSESGTLNFFFNIV